jgi:8-oxo-dGTP diphosphatase
MTVRREYPERPVVGVGGVVVSGDRVLVVRRGQPPLEGEWSIPGGMLELGETILEGVQRELAEETGLEVRVLDLIEVFERISIDSTGIPRYHFVVLDYLCEVIRGDARAGSDVTEVAWITNSDFSRYSLAPTAVRVIQKALDLTQKHAAGSGQ